MQADRIKITLDPIQIFLFLSTILFHIHYLEFRVAIALFLILFFSAIFSFFFFIIIDFFNCETK